MASTDPSQSPPSSKMAQVLALTEEIRQLRLKLEEKLAALAKLVGEAQPTPVSVTVPEPATFVRRRKGKGLVISTAVLNYVAKHPSGIRAKDVVAGLGLKDREGSVRSALKAHMNANRLLNFDGVWHVAPKVLEHTLKENPISRKQDGGKNDDD